MLRYLILFVLFGLKALEGQPIDKLTNDDNSQNPWELSGEFEGDILLLPGQRNGILDEKLRWLNFEIPYELDTAFSDEEKEKITSALKQYEQTHITPRPRQPEDVDYVYVERGSGTACSSHVGRVGGRQTIHMAQRCLTPGTIVHEFLHALGFFHQQSATDRDDYVTIVWENIMPGLEYNFDKYNNSAVGSFGEAYDYGSVMHYGRIAFSVNGKETIIPKDPNAEIGQRKGLSEIDIRKLNKMYKK